MPSFLADSSLGEYLNSPWLLGPLVFILWVAIFMVIKRYVLRALQRAAERTAWTWDDVLVRALSGPLLLPIMASGLLVFERILPLSPEWDRAFDIVMAGAMVLALVLFMDLACRGVLDRLAEKQPVLLGARGLVQGVIRGIIIAVGIHFHHTHPGLSRDRQPGGGAGAEGFPGEPVRGHSAHPRQDD